MLTDEEYYRNLARRRRNGAWIGLVLLIFTLLLAGLALFHPHGIAGAAREVGHYYGRRLNAASGEDDDAGGTAVTR